MTIDIQSPAAASAPAAPKVSEPATIADALAQFVEGSALGRAVYCVVGDEGIAAVPSPHDATRSTYLFWSHQGEAERWADVLVAAPKVVAIDLPGFLMETLPAITAVGALAGIDWTADPLEAEQEPAALGGHLREELARDFAAVATRTRMVWMLVDGNGITGIRTPEGQRVTPVWGDRFLADAAVAAIGDRSLTAVRKPLLELTNRYLLSSEGVKAELAPGYIHAPGAVTMSPWALKALLNGAPRTQARIAVVSG